MSVGVLKKHATAVVLTLFVSYSLVILYLMFLAPSEGFVLAYRNSSWWTLILSVILYTPIYRFFIRGKRDVSAHALVRNWMIGVAVFSFVLMAILAAVRSFA